MPEPTPPKPQPDPEKYVAEWRECLHCHDYFNSSWVGNRICTRCGNTPKFKQSNNDQPMPVHVKK